MKKHLLLGAVLITASAQAQITITMADVAPVNTVIYQANDTMPTVSVGSAGASQVWNMSALANHSVDTLSFLPYSAAPNPKFATANLVIRFGSQPAYAYGVVNSSKLEIQGNHFEGDLGGGSPVIVDQMNSPAEKLSQFPNTFNSSFSNNYTTRATFFFGVSGIDSVRQTSAVQKSELTDAWGSLSTPLGTFGVLRNKETKISHDTVEFYVNALGSWVVYDITADSTTSYSFWANGVGFPLVVATKDSSNAVSRVQWLLATPTSIQEHVFGEVSTYPNPASEQINFAFEATNATSVQILDLAGRVVAEETVNSDIVTISTAALSNGAYLYQVTGRTGDVLAKGKCFITH